MKNFRFLAMLLLGVLLNVNLISCSKDDNLPEKGDDKVEHPNGIPNKIPNNVIYYTTKDNIIVRLKNEDVFGGAKIVSNTYSSTKGYGTIEFASEVTAIESKAFMKQSTLTYIAFSNSVTSIGNSAFEYCSGLTSVTIPNSVVSIGNSAFEYCSGLTSVQISDITAWCNIDFGDCFSNPLSYAHHLYMKGKEVKDLVIPKSVTSIGKLAFYECSGLTSVTIPNSVKRVGNSAFEYCDGLTSVTIGNSVESIGDEAFRNCFGLTSVTIGNCVTSIGSDAFYNCSGLTSVTIPNSVESIGSDAFEDCSGLTSVHISDIAAWCNIDFYGTDSNPLSYAHHLYMKGREVKDLVIPKSVTSIGGAAFYKCSGLTSVTIPNSVTSIGNAAFLNCDGLPSVTIGNSVKSIGNSAFEYCSELLDVYCYAENVPSTGSNAFYGSYPEYATLHVPAASIDSYKASAPWRWFGKIVALTK